MKHKGRGRPRLNEPHEMMYFRLRSDIANQLKSYSEERDISMTSVVAKLISDNLPKIITTNETGTSNE